MIVPLSVKLSRKQESVVSDGSGYIVTVKALPVKGAANERIVEVLAQHLGIPKSAVKIVKGWTSRHKVAAIDVDH